MLGTLLVGIAAGGVTLALGQIAFATIRSLILRAVIAAAFAVPATLLAIMSPLDVANRSAFACSGARSSLASARSSSAAQRGRV